MSAGTKARVSLARSFVVGAGQHGKVSNPLCTRTAWSPCVSALLSHNNNYNTAGAHFVK